MKKVKYIGRHDAVDLELPDGSEIVVEHDKTIEVDDNDFAALLVEQEENWEPVGWKPKKPEPEAAADPAIEEPAADAGEKE